MPAKKPDENDAGDGDAAGGESDEVIDESRVVEIVREVLGKLGVGGDDDDNAGGDDDAAGDGKPAPRTQAAVEDDVAAKVRAEIAKLRTEDERDSRLAALEEKVKEPERPPVKERVSTRLMGWNRKARA